MTPEKPVRRRTAAQTRERLIDAAEALFAERGVDNVTLLDVTRAAGQRNRSALQYHFGDKAGLLNAVFDRHSEAIAARRAQMLDALQAQGSYGLHDVVEALVVPVADRVSHGGEAYLQLNSQLMASQHWSGFRLQRGEIGPVTLRLREMLHARLPSLTKQELSVRLLLMDVMLFHGLATYATRSPRPGLRYFLDSLTNAITAVLRREPDADN